MRPLSHKTRYALIGAIIVPCFGRLALHGTGHEHDYYRFLIPLVIGGIAGALVGYMKDRLMAINAALAQTNQLLKQRMEAHRQLEAALRESEERYRTLFMNSHTVMLIIDPVSADIVDANPAATAFYGWQSAALRAKKITDINALSKDRVFRAMGLAKTEKPRPFVFKHRLASGDLRDVEVFSGPILLKGRKLLFSIIHDVTDRILTENEREDLIRELQEALKEIKTLRGIIPICSKCKNIRNDEGAWKKLEEYISENSNAEFSHGLCPDCIALLYPDLDI